MLINAPSITNRTKILEDEYFKLLQSGVSAENILVLVQNYKKKKEFINNLKERFSLGSIGNIRVYSFSGLIYNYILENWAVVENSINEETNRKIIPNLCGLEVSQYIFKECINFIFISIKFNSIHNNHLLFKK